MISRSAGGLKAPRGAVKFRAFAALFAGGAARLKVASQRLGALREQMLDQLALQCANAAMIEPAIVAADCRRIRAVAEAQIGAAASVAVNLERNIHGRAAFHEKPTVGNP